MVSAKVRCVWNRSPQWDSVGTNRTVRFTPVYDSNPESPNYSWSQATPSGLFEMNISNPAAFDQFEENKEYLVTFENA